MANQEKRRARLQQWLTVNERSIAWLARRTQYGRLWVSKMYNGHEDVTDPFTAKMRECVFVDLDGDEPITSPYEAERETV
jgi:hypothetical protein